MGYFKEIIFRKRKCENKRCLGEIKIKTMKALIETMILPILVAILIFLGILKLINKFIFKGKIKINWKEITIGWSIIFIMNLFCVIKEIPHPVGIPYTIFGDGGQTKFYASLGYIICVENKGILEKEDNIKTTVEFIYCRKWNKFKIEKVK